MLTIIEQYIGRAILLGTLIVMVVLLTLLGIFELVKKFDEVGIGTYGLFDAFVGSLLTLPRKLFEIFPVTALVGSLLGLGSLASTGELTAMRVAGVSVRQLLVAVLKTGLLMLVFASLIGELVAPVSEEYVRKVEVEKQQKQVTLKSEHGFWARDGQQFVNIRKILPGSQLEDIYIYEIDQDKSMRLVTYASAASYLDGKWQLEGILQTAIQPEQVQSRQVGTASWSSMINPNLLEVIVVDPSRLSAWGLFQYMTFMQANNQDARLYEVAFWNKVFTPVLTVVMLTLAVPFVLGSLRSVGVGQRVFIGAMIGTVFYTLNQSFSFMAVVYDIPPLLATAIPGFVMIGLTVFLIRRLH